MQERLHEHINEELRTNTNTDTIFILAAILFNFAMLCIGSASAAAAAAPDTNFKTGSIIVYVITLLLTVLVNGIAISGLITGRGTRVLLSDGLLKMYQDSKVEKYYDSKLLTNYGQRYILFIGIVVSVACASTSIPLVILVFLAPGGAGF
jgi:hypothetical protein